MKSIRNVALPLAMCLCLILVPHQIDAQVQQETKGKDLIDKVCSKTPSKAVCVKTLSSAPNSGQAGLKELALLSLQAATSNATRIINHVKLLIDNDTLGPEIQEGLSDCKDTLLDAEDQLQDAVAALLVNVTEDTLKWLQAALDAITTCEGYLHGNDRLLMNKEEDFRLLCKIALSIAKELPIPR